MNEEKKWSCTTRSSDFEAGSSDLTEKKLNQVRFIVRASTSVSDLFDFVFQTLE
jgi:hypothetical protein